MTIGKRIKDLRGKVARHDFAALLGVSRSTVQRYEIDEDVPDTAFVKAICERYKVSADWLIFGKELEKRADKQHSQSSPLDYDYIPMVEAKLSAGGGAFVESEAVRGYYAFRKDWLSQVTTSVKGLVLMRVTGNSMYPTLHGNDRVLIDTNRLEVKEGQIYALRLDHTILVKRLAYRPESKILVISDNKQEFTAYEVAMKDLHILGEVIFFSRVLIPEGNQ
jgi:phage repressor protein C with HTH and peptisase S24 domain